MSSPFTTVLSDIKAALVAAAAAASLTRGVYLRKRFQIHERDVLPMWVVFPGKESDRQEDSFESSLYFYFPVFVGVALDTGNLLDSASLTTMLDDRWLIWQTCRSIKVTHPNTAPVIGIGSELDPPFDKSAVKDNLDVSAMLFTYELQVQRNT